SVARGLSDRQALPRPRFVRRSSEMSATRVWPSADDPRIALVGALDTKGTEYRFLRKEVERLGRRAVLIAAGVLGAPFVVADISREEVAARQGASIEELRSAGERGPGMRAMSAGAAAYLVDLVAE